MFQKLWKDTILSKRTSCQAAFIGFKSNSTSVEKDHQSYENDSAKRHFHVAPLHHQSKGESEETSGFSVHELLVIAKIKVMVDNLLNEVEW